MTRLETDPQRSALMRRVRRSGTPAEDTVARCCRLAGLAYRRNVRDLPGSPDLANKTRRFAIFVNGCFWHRHKGCRLATTPRRNAGFWQAKFAANRARDARKIKELRIMGFRVAVIWQCQTRDETALLRRLAVFAARLE